MKLRLIVWATLLLNACLVNALPQAVQLNRDNIQALRPAGPDAIAGLGDWVLSNGTLCAAVSDLTHETGFLPWGGALVDVHHCGQADDQWPFQHALANLDKDTPLRPVAITSESASDRATIQVRSEGYGLRLLSRYQVSAAQPRQLKVVHELSRIGEGRAVTLFGLLMLHPHLALTPFSLSTFEPETSRGFSYPSMDRQDAMSMLDAMLPADIHVMVGEPALGQVAYGVHLESAELIDEKGRAQPLPRFQQTDPTYSIQGMLSRPPWIGGSGKLGLLEFGQSRLMDVEPGETLRVSQVIYLGDRADVASVTDQIYQGVRVAGSVDAAGAVIHVRDAGGLPITSARADEQGQFAFQLPVGANRVELLVATPWGDSQAGVFEVGSESMDLGRLASSAPAVLDIVTDLPLRLTFIGLGDTPDPDFYNNSLRFQVDDQAVVEIQSANYLSFAGIDSDPNRVSLAPGRYRVLASRGMAYGVTETEISMTSGENPVLVVASPLQEVTTKDWLAADFHVHAAPSFDSYIPIDERLRGFVAQGGEVLVATEHNVLVNYQKDVLRLGLSETLQLIGGTELTGMARTEVMPFTNGHINAFPLIARGDEFAGGVPAHEGRRLRSLYYDLQQRFGRVLLQLNHPRATDPLDAAGDNSYFEHLVNGTAYDPAQPLGAEVNRSLIERDPQQGLRDLDFHVMEIANGPSYQSYIETRGDWFSLLNQGEKIMGSANSDTHGTRALVAIPQNFVKMTSPYQQSTFMDAIRQGRLFGTTGPLLAVTATGASGNRMGMGETIEGGGIKLRVAVEAASWIPVETLNIYLNGELYRQQSVERGDVVELAITVAVDSYVVVEVTAEPSALYHALAPGFTPFAFSNPVFIDANSDGIWAGPAASRLAEARNSEARNSEARNSK